MTHPVECGGLPPRHPGPGLPGRWAARRPEKRIWPARACHASTHFSARAIGGVLFLCACIAAYGGAAALASDERAQAAYEVPDLLDFGSAGIALRCDEAVEPARAEGHAVSGGFSSNRPAFRVDFQLPCNANGIYLGPLHVAPEALPEDPWGIEFWMKLDAPHPIHLRLMVREEAGELWDCPVPLPPGDRLAGWNRVEIPLDWLRVVSWERIDGQLKPATLQDVSIKLSNADESKPCAGALWLAGVRLLDARHDVPAEQHGPFTLLQLGEVYDSDGVAFKTNPMDGDFHTGEWQHRALPAESFPRPGIATHHGIPFQMPDVSDGVNNHIRCNGQKLTGLPAAHYSAIYALTTGKFGEEFGDLGLTYADGTRQDVMLRVSDWTEGPTCDDRLAITFPYTYYEQTVENRHSKLYVQSVRVDGNRVLSAVELPKNDYLKVFALTLYAGEVPPAVGAMQERPVVEVFPVFAMKRVDELNFDEPMEGVGVFGGYLYGKQKRYDVDEPTFNGYPAFAADAGSLTRNPPVHELLWDCFEPDGGPRVLGGVGLLGTPAGPVQVELLDWTCIKYTGHFIQEGESVPFSVYGSRASPAILYETGLRTLRWRTPGRSGTAFASLEAEGAVKTQELTPGQSLPVLTAPWLLIWHTEGGEESADAPMLLVFEKQPGKLEARQGDNGVPCLDLEFPRAAGRLAAMPLFGIRQVPFTQTQGWVDTGLPAAVTDQCRAWAARLQAYPIGVEEQTEVDERAQQLTVHNRFTYVHFDTDYGVTPAVVAMMPPVVVLAQQNGYDVELSADAVSTECDTFWGPVVLARGNSFTYTIPLPRYIDHMPVPIGISGSPVATTVQEELAKLIDERVPQDLTKTRFISDTCGDLARLRVLAPSRLVLGDSPTCDAYGATVAENALRPQNLKVEKEPLTGQFYLMDDRFWAKDESFDKEWAIGYILQGLWNYTYYSGNEECLRSHWDRIRGLYTYYRLVFDWATCSTFTVATGMGANSDGVRIACEGMLAMARMARCLDDEETYADACARSAKQMLSLYASWFAPRWASDHDYATQENRRVPAGKAECRFAPDTTWSETRTCNVAHPTEFFQATHAFYIFNLACLASLHDTGLDERFLRDWVYRIVPELHPAWYDGNVMCEPSGRYYGSDHTMAHIILRALVFHEEPERLYDYYRRSSGDTRVTTQWYSPLGTAPAVFTAILMGQAPLVIAPVGRFSIVANTYDAQQRVLRTVMRRIRTGQDYLLVRCWQQTVEKVRVNDGEALFHYDEKTDYLRIELDPQLDGLVDVRIQFGGPNGSPPKAPQGGEKQ